MKKEDRRSAEVIPFPRAPREAPAEPAEEPKRVGLGSRIVAAIVHFKARSGAVRKVIGLLPRWVTPNGVTVFRGLLIAPIVLLMRDGLYLAALLTLAFAMLLDFVDGALAHVRNMRSETGAFLDPLADKILVCGVLIAALPTLPAWAWVPVTAVCAFAALLTLLRVAKLMTMKRREQDVDGKRIAASSTGRPNPSERDETASAAAPSSRPIRSVSST